MKKDGRRQGKAINANGMKVIAVLELEA